MDVNIKGIVKAFLTVEEAWQLEAELRQMLETLAADQIVEIGIDGLGDPDEATLGKLWLRVTDSERPFYETETK